MASVASIGKQMKATKISTPIVVPSPIKKAVSSPMLSVYSAGNLKVQKV